jgi:hypothetical protein
VRRLFRISFAAYSLATSAGCELTATVFVQQEYNTNPHLHSKPDGLAKAEIKVTKLTGKDVKK